MCRTCWLPIISHPSSLVLLPSRSTHTDHAMKRVSILLLLLVGVAPLLHAQPPNLLQSGPMVGYSEMTEVMLWAQTTAEATVQFRYWAAETPSQKFLTKEVRTASQQAFTAHIVAEGLLPGTRYQYELLVNGAAVERPYPLEFQTQKLWQWREDPPPFTLALGSCAYVNEPPFDRPGEPYGGEYQIYTSIHRLRPDVMLWLGDNTYLREADWGSRSGILHRYTHTRSLPELQPLLASAHNYAIWDDHDFGPNDSDRGFRKKENTWDAFKLFWANTSYGNRDIPGICTSFKWGDVDFFLLDNRWDRSPNLRTTGERQILGDQQIEWLVDQLATSQAPFKIVAIGGQVLNPVAKWENHATFPEERQKLIDALTQEKIEGVIFLSGDRHHSELSKMNRPGLWPLYDLTVSPLTSRAHNNPEEANTMRVEGTYVGQRNFATLSFSGPRSNRAMKIAMFDSEGKELWTQTIMAKELSK